MNETVQFFSSDPRERRAIHSETGETCYETRNGRRCAVGRYMEDPGHVENICTGDVDDLVETFGSLDALLREEYREFPVGFWRLIQEFHDQPSNWTEQDLSQLGRKSVHRIERWIMREFSEVSSST